MMPFGQDAGKLRRQMTSRLFRLGGDDMATSIRARGRLVLASKIDNNDSVVLTKSRGKAKAGGVDVGKRFGRRGWAWKTME